MLAALTGVATSIDNSRHKKISSPGSSFVLVMMSAVGKFGLALSLLVMAQISADFSEENHRIASRNLRFICVNLRITGF
jgi:isochorismate hydrolase